MEWVELEGAGGDEWIQKETEMCAQGKGITCPHSLHRKEQESRVLFFCFLNPQVSQRGEPLPLIPPSGIEMYILP